MYESTKKTLMLNGYIYGIVTVIFVIVSLVKGSMFILNLSLIPFAIMSISMFLGSVVYSNAEKRVNIATDFIAMIILGPVAVVLYILVFVVTFIACLFVKDKPKGGDKDYE